MRSNWSALFAAALTAAGASAQPSVASRTAFAAVVARLSEPGGYFDTDNLISNEPSYLHALGKLQSGRVSGGAYVGVGPDQNYSYLVAIRPEVAYLLDIRRDNALQHLMYKALFARSRNRMEYMCRWLGRRAPADLDRWTGAPVDLVLSWLERPGLDSATAFAERRATLAAVEGFGIPLTDRDRETILRFHAEFQRQGLDLRFTSHGRFNAAEYPSLRELVLETDDRGRRASYLVREEDWRVVRELHATDRIIPVVGDLAGATAMRAVADDMRRRGLVLSAIYTSNAEQYVLRDRGYAAFAANVERLPANARSVIVRSYFNRGIRHPLAVEGYRTTQVVTAIPDFLRRYSLGHLGSWWSVVTLDARD